MKRDILENITGRTNKMWNELLQKKGDNWGLVVNGLGEVLLLDGRYTGNALAKGNRNVQRKIKDLMNS